MWREMEMRMGPSKGKSFDTANVIGPWIVTPDEIGDVQALDVEVRINGESWGRNTTAHMLHSFEDMIAYISRDETLHKGELFCSGTVGGCSGLELDRWLKPGDVMELEVSRIGVLRNRIVKASGEAS
jgi:2-keto-4-pentenoate hydratase/2-oxohepta-3-ene-1,7-dioic acid hydratase in catechol pathway